MEKTVRNQPNSMPPASAVGCLTEYPGDYPHLWVLVVSQTANLFGNMLFTRLNLSKGNQIEPFSFVGNC